MKRYRTCRTRQCVLNATLAFCRVVKDRHATMQAGCVHRKLKLRGSQKTHLRCILYDELIDEAHLNGCPQKPQASTSGTNRASMRACYRCRPRHHMRVLESAVPILNIIIIRTRSVMLDITGITQSAMTKVRFSLFSRPYVFDRRSLCRIS